MRHFLSNKNQGVTTNKKKEEKIMDTKNRLTNYYITEILTIIEHGINFSTIDQLIGGVSEKNKAQIRRIRELYKKGKSFNHTINHDRANKLKKLYSTGKFGQFAFKLSVYQIELSRAQYYRLIRLVFNVETEGEITDESS